MEKFQCVSANVKVSLKLIENVHLNTFYIKSIDIQIDKSKIEHKKHCY